MDIPDEQVEMITKIANFDAVIDELEHNVFSHTTITTYMTKRILYSVLLFNKIVEGLNELRILNDEEINEVLDDWGKNPEGRDYSTEVAKAQFQSDIKGFIEWLEVEMPHWIYCPDDKYNDDKLTGWLDHEFKVRESLKQLMEEKEDG